MNDKIKVSAGLRDFLQAWLDWAEGDPLNGKPFYRCTGLCNSLRDWCLVANSFGHAVCDALYLELSALFERDGLDEDYPFGEGEYWTAHDEDTMHLCPKRLAWVRSTLARSA